MQLLPSVSHAATSQEQVPVPLQGMVAGGGEGFASRQARPVQHAAPPTVQA